MKTRRIIAALTAAVFLLIWCGPAFATVVAASLDSGGCCCAEEETTEHETIQDIPCRCASCACSIGDGEPFSPISATASPTAMMSVAGAATAVPDLLLQPAQRDLAQPVARGPPPGASPPLYLLYDTWLI